MHSHIARMQARHYLDIFLYSHTADLTNLIRDRALVLYFRPFASIKLQRMSAAFGLTPDEMERTVVMLIQSGGIKGRVDRRNGVCSFFNRSELRLLRENVNCVSLHGRS